MRSCLGRAAFGILTILIAICSLLMSAHSSAAISSSSISATLPQLIPILMYHYIAPITRTTTWAGRDLSVTPTTFASHLEWLKAHGYTSIGFTDLIAGKPLPKKPVIITFDDGYEDAYSNAFPLLKKFGFKGVFYVITSFAGTKGYATWDQLKDMHNAGMEIGAHTVSHHDLSTLPQTEQHVEISDSIATLQTKLKIIVASVAYPFGKFNETTLRVMRAVDIPYAVTTREGLANPKENLILLPRMRIKEKTKIEEAVVGIFRRK